MSDFAVSPLAKRTVYLYGVSAALVLVLMIVLGILMRLSQGMVIQLPADFFYQIMTAHGAGMVGIAGLAGAAIMWYFLRQYVELTTSILVANLVLFLIGVVFILSAIFIGRFAGAWTFLYPLPAHSMGVWSAGAAIAFLFGLLLVGSGFLLLYLDAGRAIIARYGGLGGALGWPQLFRGSRHEAPPPTVVAGAMVTIINVPALIVGASILIISIINILAPDFMIDALLAKNMIYFFGHTFINATIYMSIIAVYELLPRYTKRPWKSTKIFLLAWTASTIMVLIVYPHHLLMDFVLPNWMLIMGQIVSYTSGLPVLVVTMIGALAIVYRSGIRWDLTSGLLFFSIFGWAGGIFPAVIDATITINKVMHNTLWVPGHFHFYLLLGMIAMFLGFMCHLSKTGKEDSWFDKAGFWLYALGGLVFVFLFLLSGKMSVARRFAVHLPEWSGYAAVSSFFAILVLIATIIFTVRFLARLRKL